MKLRADNQQLNRALEAVTAQRLKWLETGDLFDRLRLEARQKHIECSWYPHSVLGTYAADVARQLYRHTNTVPLPSEVNTTMEHIRRQWTNKRTIRANRIQTLTQSLSTLTTD